MIAFIVLFNHIEQFITLISFSHMLLVILTMVKVILVHFKGHTMIHSKINGNVWLG
jgi:hypothetical protein